MAYASSNDAKMKLVGGAVFVKFGLLCLENCNFAHNVKGIAAMRLILVRFTPKWPMLIRMMAKIKFVWPFLQNLGFFAPKIAFCC